MELTNGIGRGSYIWGRSVHNVRIERLWVDLTTSFGAKWHEFFTLLEFSHGLDVNSCNHIWLLHYLFLPEINQEVDGFVHLWNSHKLHIRHGTNRSPIDMFGFDMLVHGLHGDVLSPEELEVYGVDWEGLRDTSLHDHQIRNNHANEGASSWVGRVGPPPDLSEVIVDPP
ncbi:hypothetical protein BS47DRAFT_1272454, partial [Hydnum rufescens UP504]